MEERTKRRIPAHVRGERGAEIVRSRLPRHWVVRELHPDYGLDLHIEVFEPPTADALHADALGEHFFAQVKTVASLPQPVEFRVGARRNVAKFRPAPPVSSAESDAETILVHPFSIESAEIRMIETMGASPPVLLFLVDESREEVFYVCMNDYINKILLPEIGPYSHQKTWTLRLPAFNLLDASKLEFSYVRLLARRGKFYGAFATFAYQKHELQRALGPSVKIAQSPRAPLQEMLDVFVTATLRLDIWEILGAAQWAPLLDVREHMRALRAILDGSRRTSPEELAFHAVNAFAVAANLGQMYEEVCREWRLPTALAATILRAERSDFSGR